MARLRKSDSAVLRPTLSLARAFNETVRCDRQSKIKTRKKDVRIAHPFFGWSAYPRVPALARKPKLRVA